MYLLFLSIERRKLPFLPVTKPTASVLSLRRSYKEGTGGATAAAAVAMRESTSDVAEAAAAEEPAATDAAATCFAAFSEGLISLAEAMSAAPPQWKEGTVPDAGGGNLRAARGVTRVTQMMQEVKGRKKGETHTQNMCTSALKCGVHILSSMCR